MNLESLELFELLDEQNTVKFTGKVSIIERFDLHYVGSLYLIDGQLVSCHYNGSEGARSFYRLVIDHFKLKPLKFVLEPENVSEEEKNIHYPYQVLKKKTQEMLDQFEESFSHRPPNNLKILVRSDFIARGEEVNEIEFQLICDLSDWNLVSEIYAQSQLIDHEVTMALVGLRKKGALLVKGPQ